ncbi:MAG: hypothetical protein Q9187_008128 [Circinaria calcarea]
MLNVNLATTVLLIESRNSPAEAALLLPSNEDYVVNPVVEDATQHSPASREGTPFIALSSVICALLLSHKPFDPLEGWVFGSDEERCDFLLATTSKRTGVSGRHFRIHYNWTSRHLRLTNISKHHTVMSSTKLGRDIIVRDSRVIFPGEIVTVTVGVVSLSIHIPPRGECQDAFDKGLDAYCNEVQAAVPRLVTLKFSEPSQETPLVVLGKRNRVQYLIEKDGDIGKGGFGTVSKAINHITGDLYAAKRFVKVDPMAQTEIELHQRISHEHIVRFIDIQEDPLSPLLIMEYLECGNLAQQTEFTFSETVIMVKQQLYAVSYLHGVKITHRDIKPENILLESRSPRLITKLSDFGLSSDRKDPETFCGTKYYLAPEVIGRGSKYSNSVDIWSLGTVALQFAYSLPKALRKWNRSDWSNKLHYHAREQHGTLAALIQKMLTLLPVARPSAEECLLEMAFSNLLSSSPPSKAAETSRQTDISLVEIPEDPQKGVRRHQNIHLPQVGAVNAQPDRPLDLFGAITSEAGIETKVRALLDCKLKAEGMMKQNQGKSKLDKVAIAEEASTDIVKTTEEEGVGTFRLEGKDAANTESGNHHPATFHRAVTHSVPALSLVSATSPGDFEK